jgi:hemoglobin-like flavoprotein
MTPRQIDLVQISFKKVVPIAATAADLTEQKRKLMSMPGTAVTILHKLDTILPAVKDLGRRHKGYGVTVEHYAPVGADFTPDVKSAWAQPIQRWPA